MFPPGLAPEIPEDLYMLIKKVSPLPKKVFNLPGDVELMCYT